MNIDIIELKDKITPKHIVFVSFIIIAIIIAFSFYIETRSQKLPALVKAEKLAISSVTSGIAVNYKVVLNEPVQQGQLIFEMENLQLLRKIKNLKNEKSKYEEIINSATRGDHLKLKLIDVEEDLLKSENKQVELSLDKEKISNQLDIYSKKFNSANANYEVYKDLFDQKKISSSEFNERTSEYMKISNSYQNLQNDLLLVNKEIRSNKSEIELFKQQKVLYRENVSLIAEKYIVELAKINSKLNELEDEVKSLNVYSPAAGYITKLDFSSGENVKKGDQVAELSNVGKMWIIAFGNSFSRQKIKKGMKVKVYCTNEKKVYGKIESVSPVMDRVSSLSTKFETVNSYTKIEILLYNNEDATNNLTPGERLFVRVYFKK
ncbi:MAG: HlyD family efflux transporter periplasmic adaptor subunit [Candidatus Cloacimonetes bacterium]|nr:HlyD family efflux transporter periplasmic adaptor subunit [Candidatus Cloacimonadota bacterium]